MCEENISHTWASSALLPSSSFNLLSESKGWLRSYYYWKKKKINLWCFLALKKDQRCSSHWLKNSLCLHRTCTRMLCTLNDLYITYDIFNVKAVWVVFDCIIEGMMTEGKGLYLLSTLLSTQHFGFWIVFPWVFQSWGWLSLDLHSPQKQQIDCNLNTCPKESFNNWHKNFLWRNILFSCVPWEFLFF